MRISRLFTAPSVIKLWLRRLSVAVQMGPTAWAAMLLAGWHILRAEWRLRHEPFAKLAAELGDAVGPDATASPVSDSQHRTAQLASHAVRRATILLPWRPRCLVRAIALNRLLARDQIPSLMRFGVCKDPTTNLPDLETNAAEGFTAHAWVQVGEKILLGRQGAKTHAPVQSLRAEFRQPSP